MNNSTPESPLYVAAGISLCLLSTSANAADISITIKDQKQKPVHDTINVASRVEGQTRVLDTPLLITDATVALCSEYAFIELGSANKEKIRLYKTGTID